MGQAVDLPDPAQVPATAAATSADDLLSQLAGDEIDRLLAESDAEATAKAEAEAAEAKTAEAQSAVVAPTESAPADSPPSTTEPVAEYPATSQSSAAASADTAPALPATEGLANELDSLLAKAVATDDEPTPAAASAEAPAATEPLAPAAAAVDANSLDASLAATTASPELQAAVNEIETSLQERSGLTDSTAGEPALEDPVDGAPVPLYLKPLVWLNAPLLLLPDPIRDAIGKIAVLTLFNSLAVLTYVLMFRHHHH